MPTRPKLSPVERLRVTLRVLSGESPTMLAREYGVTVGRIYQLKDEARAGRESRLSEADEEYRLKQAIAEQLERSGR